MSMRMDAERQNAIDLGARKQREAEQLYTNFSSPAAGSSPLFTQTWGAELPGKDLDIVISSTSTPRR